MRAGVARLNLHSFASTDGRLSIVTEYGIPQDEFDELEQLILDELKAQLAMDREIEDIPEMIADVIVRRFQVKRR